jgi:tRNA G18 (ribose-2'-O)-methylase SpoU
VLMKNIQLNHYQHRAVPTKYPLCFLAHDIQIPENIGALFRIADALGVEKIYFSGLSPTPPNHKINKTARATEKYVDYFYENNPIKIINKLKAEQYKIVSLEATTHSIDINHCPMLSGEKWCLVLGAENSGVCQALLDLSDLTVHIPMQGQNSSMNVAAAAAIAVFEITRKIQVSAARSPY